MQPITSDPGSTRSTTRRAIVFAAVFVAVTLLSVLLLFFAPEPGAIAIIGEMELMLLVATVGCAFRQAQARAFWGGCAIWGWISLWCMYMIDAEMAVFFVLPLALVGGATARVFYLRRTSPQTRLIPWVLIPSILLLALGVAAMVLAGDQPWLTTATGLNLLFVVVGATGAAFAAGSVRAFWGSCAICGSFMMLIGTTELQQIMHALVIPAALVGGLVGRHFYLTRDSKCDSAGRLRFSLARLMVVVLSAAMGCAALVGASSVWTITLACFFIAMFLLSMVGVAFRTGAARAFWGGAAICLWGHFVILYVIGNVLLDSPYEIALDYLYEEVLDNGQEPDPVAREIVGGTGQTYTLPAPAIVPTQQRPRSEVSYGAFQLRGQMLFALIVASLGAYLGRHLYVTRDQKV